VLTAFSRDNEDGSKNYVQHAIKQNKQLLQPLIEKGGFIFVSGRAKLMPKSVEKAFVEVAGAEVVASMKQTKRY